MAKKLYEESSIQAIANAIREKNGETTTYKPSEMAAAITAITTGGGSGEVEPIVLSGSQSYGCFGKVASEYIKLFGNTISTENLQTTNNMFDSSTLEYIPFDLNYKLEHEAQIQQMFFAAYSLKALPKINNVKPRNIQSLFQGCHNLIEISDNYFDNWNFDNFYMANSTSGYNGQCNSIFYDCHLLRKLPLHWVAKMNPSIVYSYSFYNNAFRNCYVLDEIVNLPVPFTKTTWTGNAFSGTIDHCHRLKSFTFKPNEDGTPVIVSWKGQTISLQSNVGYVQFGYPERMRDAGIYDKQVEDDATYQALKDDPDWWTFKVAYSRYNHDSAVATINSLPDTSAYLTANGGTNTITFKGAAGSATDGGAINTLTEEEIAVAAAKGWTVTLV